jgi:hypothetical protein
VLSFCNIQLWNFDNVDDVNVNNGVDDYDGRV